MVASATPLTRRKPTVHPFRWFSPVSPIHLIAAEQAATHFDVLTTPAFAGLCDTCRPKQSRKQMVPRAAEQRTAAALEPTTHSFLSGPSAHVSTLPPSQYAIPMPPGVGGEWPRGVDAARRDSRSAAVIRARGERTVPRRPPHTAGARLPHASSSIAAWPIPKGLSLTPCLTRWKRRASRGRGPSALTSTSHRSRHMPPLSCPRCNIYHLSPNPTSIHPPTSPQRCTLSSSSPLLAPLKYSTLLHQLSHTGCSLHQEHQRAFIAPVLAPRSESPPFGDSH